MSVREACTCTSTVDVEVSVGNPNVEHIKGVLRLFRSVTRTPQGGKDVAAAVGGGESDDSEEEGKADDTGGISLLVEERQADATATEHGTSHEGGKGLPSERSKTLCLLGVPEHMAPSEMFMFFGAFLKTIHRIRFVRQDASSLHRALENIQQHQNSKMEEEEETASTFTHLVVDDDDEENENEKGCASSHQVVSNNKTYTSCILDFRAQKSADEFYSSYDGKRYSSLEQDICRCIFVERVFLEDDSEASSLKGGLQVTTTKQVKGAESEIISSATTATTETEMPTCPVCLERLDAHITGIATTMCNHSFHPECLKKCTMTSCPVCRYSQMGFLEEEEKTQCETCNTYEDLWICIVCGQVGCGRYAGGHARTHWMETGHCYAMELQSQRVWDYVNDEYVHRLIRSKVDGQHYLVEVPANGEVEPYLDSEHANYNSRDRGGFGFSMDGGGGSGVGGVGGGEDSHGKKSWEKNRDVILTSKIEAITLEYNHLLTVQLDSQSKYFEEQLEEMKAKLSVGQQDVRKNQEMTDAALNRARHLETSKRISEKKMLRYCNKVEETEKENHFLRELNESLLRDKKKWHEEVQRLKEGTSEKDQTIKDLEEQVRDIISHLEAKSVVSEEMVGGSIEVNENNNSQASSSGIAGRNATHKRLLKKMSKRKE